MTIPRSSDAERLETFLGVEGAASKGVGGKRTILFEVFNEFAFTSNVEEEKVGKDGRESCFVNEGRKFPLRRGLVSVIR